MITLKINNSTSKIIGLNKVQFNELRNILSYQIDDKVAYFSGAFYKKRYLIDKNGNFPTGLLYLVEKWLNKSDYDTQDFRVRPKCFQMPIDNLKTFSGVELYPDQVDAANAASSAGRGIISMPTGTGKSLVIAQIIKNHGIRTLIVVPTLELKRQLLETMAEHFGKSIIGKNIVDQDWIVVENIDALDPSMVLQRTGCLIIDEFHHSAAKTYRELNKRSWVKIFHRFGLTATPFRSQDSERLLLESILSEVIYRLDYKTAVNKGYIVPVEAYYIELPKIPVRGLKWNAVYNELVVNNDTRNTIIKDLLLKLKKMKCPTICLVKEIEHGKKLSFFDNIDFVYSQDKLALEYFNIGKLHSLIGTTGILGEGIDTKPAEVIIIAGLGKSKNQFMQNVGRGVRRYPGKASCQVIIFKDPSHKWTRDHFKTQCKHLLEEYGIKPTKLVL